MQENSFVYLNCIESSLCSMSGQHGSHYQLQIDTQYPCQEIQQLNISTPDSCHIFGSESKSICLSEKLKILDLMFTIPVGRLTSLSRIRGTNQKRENAVNIPATATAQLSLSSSGDSTNRAVTMEIYLGVFGWK